MAGGRVTTRARSTDLSVQDRVPRRTTPTTSPTSGNIILGADGDNPASQDAESRKQAFMAWVDYKLCPEAAQLSTMSANVLTNCWFDVAIDDEVPDKPETLTGVDKTYYDAVKAAVTARFGNRDQQGLAIGDLARIFHITGDANLLGYGIDDNGLPKAGGEQRWEFYASDVVDKDVTTAGTKPTFKVTTAPGVAMTLQGTVVADRLWMRHPRYRNVGRSWMIQAHEICVDLALFRMARRATGKSQILADLLMVPSESQPEDPTMETAWGEGSTGGSVEEYAKDIEEMIRKALADAISDGVEGRQVLPIVMAVEQEFIDAFTTLAISRKIDSELRPTIGDLRKELAEVADMPPESLFGLGSTNRWNGRQVTEEEFRRYLGPQCKEISVNLTEAVAWRELKAANPNIKPEVFKRFTIKINNSMAVVQTDFATLMPTLLKERVVGQSGGRRLLGIDEKYAPTTAEKADAKAALEAAKPQPPVAGDPNANGEPPNKGQGTGRQRQDTVAPDNTGPAGAVNRVAGSAAPEPASDPLDGQVTHLSLVEREAWARLDEACEAAWDAAMARAGSQFKNFARADKELKAIIEPMDACKVPIFLADAGRTVDLAALRDFATPTERDGSIFGPALVALAAAWVRIVDQAWARSDLDVPQSEIDRARENSSAVLRDSMIAALSARVFAGWTAPVEMSGRIPKTILRRALAVAGGEPGVGAGFEPTAEAARGMLFGPLGLRALGATPIGWRWEYGLVSARQKVAQFHHELDGITFSSFADPKLAGGPFGQRFPGDHLGDQCFVVPVFA